MNEQASAAQLGVAGVVVGLLAMAASVGAIGLTLVDVVVLLGVAIVLPLALPGRWAWAAAALAALISLAVAPGPLAATFVLPWILLAGAVLVRRLQGWVGDRPTWAGTAHLVAAAWALVAGISFAASRGALGLFGIGEPIVELTAVHYTYAGVGALVLAADAHGRAPDRWASVGIVAIILTAAAPVVVATGFTLRSAPAQVGGAVAMASGVRATATLELRDACRRGRPLVERALSAVSGVAIWLPMVLAVAWAAGQHGDVPALSIPAMARTHGLANALGFVLGGLVARRLAGRRPGARVGTLRPPHAAEGNRHEQPRRRAWVVAGVGRALVPATGRDRDRHDAALVARRRDRGPAARVGRHAMDRAQRRRHVLDVGRHGVGTADHADADAHADAHADNGTGIGTGPPARA